MPGHARRRPFVTLAVAVHDLGSARVHVTLVTNDLSGLPMIQSAQSRQGRS